MKSTAGRLATGMFLLGATGVTCAAPLAVVDQQQLVGGAFGSAGPLVHIGQSFTPALTGIDAIEFHLASLDGGPINAFVNLRDTAFGPNFTGNIVGTSLTVQFSGTTFQTVHFDFGTTLPLAPGTKYIAEIVMDAVWLIDATLTNPYAGGKAIDGMLSPPVGAPVGFVDNVFRTGLHGSQLPEPATWALTGVGLAGLAWGRRRRER